MIFKRLLHKYAKQYYYTLKLCTTSAIAAILTINLIKYYNTITVFPEIYDKNWLTANIEDLLQQADKQYMDENYMEAYQTLNSLKYQDNVEVQWRLCRVLFKLSCVETKQKTNMIKEAYYLLSRTIELSDDNAQVYKWMAIVSNSVHGLNGTYAKILNSPKVYKHLQKSEKLNSEDPVVLYMLGVWYYKVAQMNWIQKHIARLLFFCPEKCTKEQAYKYFLKAETIEPRFFLGNIYMLGLCNYDFKKFIRAKFYFEMAADLPVYSELDAKFAEDAKRYVKYLKKYNSNSDVL